MFLALRFTEHTLSLIKFNSSCLCQLAKWIVTLTVVKVLWPERGSYSRIILFGYSNLYASCLLTKITNILWHQSVKYIDHLLIKHHLIQYRNVKYIGPSQIQIVKKSRWEKLLWPWVSQLLTCKNINKEKIFR